MGGAGAGHEPRPRAPGRGHPSFPTLPTALLAPGTGLEARTRTEQACTPARTRRSDWGGLPGHQAEAGDARTRRSLAACRAAGNSTS